ncbi:TrkA C-terminal domain-containing protein [Rummeliibacillus stabekisii]|uniref:TrkA C-terminal domain-containing protein n=1 Tax=Rummeliibacillus stabekisii TaxID=241244 RepID=UPI00203C4E06|nr:TrkA C-terminal domain-containing protein [Rummeliibacillus stabekisii]MCM3315520.1 TrkA C-terminal domain-containing protein [Rummeliibacillus stabekisii]
MGYVFIMLYFVIIGFVIEISVMLFHFTGLKTKISRFQVISMLTATGFTTDESKIIIDHPIRRKIASFLILFGAFSLAVIISSISNILSDDLRLKELSIICGVLFAILAILKLPLTRKKLTRSFKRELENEFQIYERPVKDVLYLDSEDFVTEMNITEHSKLVGKRISDILDEEEDIRILFIKRGEVWIRKDLFSCTLNQGDQVLLYGNKKEIEEKFARELNQRTI